MHWDIRYKRGGGLSLPRVTPRKEISHETVTERDKEGWVVLKTQI